MFRRNWHAARHSASENDLFGTTYFSCLRALWLLVVIFVYLVALGSFSNCVNKHCSPRLQEGKRSPKTHMLNIVTHIFICEKKKKKKKGGPRRPPVGGTSHSACGARPHHGVQSVVRYEPRAPRPGHLFPVLFPMLFFFQLRKIFLH